MTKKRSFFESFRPTRINDSAKKQDTKHHDDLSSSDLASEESTDFKIALLSSLLPDFLEGDLLELLLSCDGSVERASDLALSGSYKPTRLSAPAHTGNQSSVSTFFKTNSSSSSTVPKKIPFPLPPVPKGKTIHLSTPELVPQYTPCTLHPSFLPTAIANTLLEELLQESPTYGKEVFRLFDRTVTSPHTACFYVSDNATGFQQKKEYMYNGKFLEDIRPFTPTMASIVPMLEQKVNQEVAKRAETVYPGGRKLKYQMKLGEWKVNTAFINCYDGGKESVGWHSDQLTYLGPRAIIATISLGVNREFRLRRVAIPSTGNEEEEGHEGGHNATEIETAEIKRQSEKTPWSENEGQSSIHLPHNSLLIMHAECQESYKHAIHPASTITPHPIAGNIRLSITYRCYRPALHPSKTPRCSCGVPCVLRSVQRKEENIGKYFWMCHAGNAPDRENCTFFEWARFDDDGEPIWRNEPTSPYTQSSEVAS